MATTKKYLSLDKLGIYDEKIKAYLANADTTVLNQAKAHADGLADNYEAAGSVATAKAELEGKIATAQAQADKGVTDAATADGKAVAAQNTANQAVADAAAADAKAVATQEDVDTLADQVGTVPEGQTVMGIITNIQESAYDDTEIRGLIGDNADAIDAMDKAYKAADTTLQGNIDAVSGRVDTLVGTDANKSVRTIANEELAKQLIAEGAQESLDTLAEIAAWIQSHPDDAAAMNLAIEDLEALVGELPTGVAATTIVGYIQEAVAAEKSRAEGIENGLEERLAAVEEELGDGTGSVTEQIATAKQAAIDAAAGDATAKANKALEDAKTYSDAEDAKIEARVDALEAVDHEHENKTLLDSYTQTEANLADAVAKKHEHANLTVLNGIDSTKVSTWDTVTSKAAQADLTAEVNRAKAAEEANKAAIDAFVEISEEEINAMFNA